MPVWDYTHQMLIYIQVFSFITINDPTRFLCTPMRGTNGIFGSNVALKYENIFRVIPRYSLSVEKLHSGLKNCPFQRIQFVLWNLPGEKYFSLRRLRLKIERLKTKKTDECGSSTFALQEFFFDGLFMLESLMLFCCRYCSWIVFSRLS